MSGFIEMCLKKSIIMKKGSAVIAAFLTAPFISACFAVALTPAVRSQGLITFFGFLAIFYVVSAIITGLIAFPTYWFLSRIDKVNVFSIVASGVVTGMLTYVGISFPASTNLSDLLRLGMVGGVSAIVFWLIWRLDAT
jgi:hypothetical protein